MRPKLHNIQLQIRAPTLHTYIEQKLWAEGYTSVMGFDEAGRGPWAGPLVVGTVIFAKDTPVAEFKNIRDSKKMSPKQREECFHHIKEIALWHATGIATAEEIDTLGLSLGTQLAMTRAIDQYKDQVEYCLLDANMWRTGQKTKPVQAFQQQLQEFFTVPHESFIQGEDVSVSIAAASILAKVARDRIMEEYATHYPAYGFERHKGYGTKVHQTCLATHGCTPIHRTSFKPVQKFLKKV